MRILVVSDLHGDLEPAHRACAVVRPDVLLSCGDWGDAGQLAEADLAPFIDRTPVYTTFGNHDPIELLSRLRNRDGSAVLLPHGEIRVVGGLRLAAIGGIWAKSHAKSFYVTDADVATAAAAIKESGPVDLLLTHGCPIGLADLTASGRHGGQRCFLEAFKTIAPKVHLCGHLHLAQERILKDGGHVINVGTSAEGSIVVVEFDPKTRSLAARLEQLPAS
jgi:Icc-related predicted phosphoesterase